MTRDGGAVLAYLDHAATTPLLPEAARAMAACQAAPVNPSGGHRAARAAKRLLEDAREAVAAFVGAEPLEVVFVSGGTEADNLAISGTVGAAQRAQATLARGAGALVVACSAVEHPAVLETCRALERRSAGAPRPVRHLELPVDRKGRLEVASLEELLPQETVLVSVMAANNESGVLQPVPEVVSAVRRCAPTALVHTDAVQAAPWTDLPALTSQVDLVSISGHKLGGPVGIGALVVRSGVPLEPLLLGGQQERGLRSGTPDVVGAVGLAAAVREVARDRDRVSQRVRALRDDLARRLCAAVPGVSPVVPLERCLPGHLLVRVDGVDHEELVVLLDEAGVAASAGSACASGAVDPSHVLRAMGFSPAEARTALRFSLGSTTTPEECVRAVEALAASASLLRAAA